VGSDGAAPAEEEEAAAPPAAAEEEEAEDGPDGCPSTLLASSTRSVLPSNPRPFRALMALFASFVLPNSTKPYPFDVPDGCSYTQQTREHGKRRRKAEKAKDGASFVLARF
jgi:hypothetical protein